MLPASHAAFLKRAMPRLEADLRVQGVAAGGSWTHGGMDAWSDLDLLIVSAATDHPSVMLDREKIVHGLGPVLSCFPGDHVGEERLLICLFDDPLLHVDLKFVTLQDLSQRIENPVVLWERASALTAALGTARPHYPIPDPQWIEDRFWVWLHYGTDRLARGELFEVLDLLSWLRARVLGPLALMRHGKLPQGVRRLEQNAPEDLAEMKSTVATHDSVSCGKALVACAQLYNKLREAVQAPITRRAEAEWAAIVHLEDVLRASEPANASQSFPRACPSDSVPFQA